MMKEKDRQFQLRVWDYYHTHKRRMPWRDNHDFYSVLVSELMLQQTQVSRVIVKFALFMKRFPDVETLAGAPLAEVLIEWQGLGYNRRAKFLHESAKCIAGHATPTTIDELVRLPGVGKNTAAAICAYVYNQPVMFIETNIRTVFIHEYFEGDTVVDDKAIVELVERTLDYDNPREWYWALMDYGSYLKAGRRGSIRRSSSYVKQSTFHGSLRQARGDILRRLTTGPVDTQEILRVDDRYQTALEGLIKDGLVERHQDVICLTAHSQQS